MLHFCTKAIGLKITFRSLLVRLAGILGSMARRHPKRYFVNELNEKEDVDVGSAARKKQLQAITMDLAEKIVKHLPLKDRNCDSGLYVGLGGVGYGMWHAARNIQSPSDKKVLLEHAMQYLQYNLQFDAKHGDKQDKPSFLLGTCGLLTACALLYADLGMKAKVDDCLKELASLADKVIPVKFLNCGGDELFVGRSGYMCAVLNIRLKLRELVISDEKLLAIMSSVITSGRNHSSARPPRVPLMYSYYDTEYLGAAHGLSSILQMLMSFPHLLRKIDAKAESDVRASVDFLLSLQQTDGNFPCAMDELREQRAPEDELVHWCHGAAGNIYLMARAYNIWNDDKYLQSCIRCGEIIWQKGLLRKGPGICHGVAGSAYAFVLLFQLTKEEKYLKRAHLFADFVQTDQFLDRMLAPDCPWSLFEGSAGLLCLYADLIDPEQAYFPLFPTLF